jgi:hypothetical protein
MAKEMIHMLDEPIDRNNVAETAKHLSWKNYAKAILNK